MAFRWLAIAMSFAVCSFKNYQLPIMAINQFPPPPPFLCQKTYMKPTNSLLRFSAFGGRAGIYARVTTQRLRGALALVKTEAAFIRWLLVLNDWWAISPVLMRVVTPYGR